MAVQVEHIKSIPYFAGLSSAELESIKSLVFEVEAERGKLLLLEGEPSESLYFVVSGAVKVFKTSADGKEQILQIMRPGEAFNEVPVFDGGLNLATAQAMGPVVIYGIKKENLETILRNHSKVALNAIRVLSQKLRHVVSLVEDLSFRHVNARVAKILLEYASDGSGDRQRLTQQEMAAMAGTAREMIGRSLKDLMDEGIIRLERHRIVIADKEALKKMAGMVA
ncbi:MAG TPA: Crp/Fnr family transcriptional regulator [Dehalococcoidia bacterium]|nr:Crp/Fnr family transcriptional regulator [Dehalococcoidia bacterium]